MGLIGVFNETGQAWTCYVVLGLGFTLLLIGYIGRSRKTKIETQKLTTSWSKQTYANTFHKPWCGFLKVNFFQLI